MAVRKDKKRDLTRSQPMLHQAYPSTGVSQAGIANEMAFPKLSERRSGAPGIHMEWPLRLSPLLTFQETLQDSGRRVAGHRRDPVGQFNRIKGSFEFVADQRRERGQDAW